jgi:hypothetical protein
MHTPSYYYTTLYMREHSVYAQYSLTHTAIVECVCAQCMLSPPHISCAYTSVNIREQMVLDSI